METHALGRRVRHGDHRPHRAPLRDRASAAAGHGRGPLQTICHRQLSEITPSRSTSDSGQISDVTTVGISANVRIYPTSAGGPLFGRSNAAFGIRIVGRSQRLTLNYRTTAQNLAWAVGVLSGGQFVDLEEGAEKSADYRSARSGPVPRLVPCANLSAELDQAAEIVTAWIEDGAAPETVAVLVRDSMQRDRVVAALGERGVGVRPVDRGSIKPGQPVVMTMHRAKGTEFSRVLLFGVSQEAIPSPVQDETYSPDALAEALLRERSLLYVAATRARDELAVSWSGQASEFL